MSNVSNVSGVSGVSGVPADAPYAATTAGDGAIDGAGRPAPIGVVVAVHDADPWLPAALASLQAQTDADWTCVVVDDGSTDGSRVHAEQVARHDARFAVLGQQQQGVSAARTRGLSALPVAAVLVLFLDADDVLLPEALAVLRAALIARPEAVGAYGLADYIDANGVVIRPGAHPALQQARRVLRGRRLADQEAGTDTTFATLVAMNPIWPAAVGLHRRQAISAAGGFAGDLPVQEDWDLYLRMSREGPFVEVPAHVARYRRHGSNLTSVHRGHSLAQAQVRHRAWRSTASSPDQRRQVARVWRFLLARRAGLLLLTLREALVTRDGVLVLLVLRAWLAIAPQLLLPGPPRPTPRSVSWADPDLDGRGDVSADDALVPVPRLPRVPALLASSRQGGRRR